MNDLSLEEMNIFWHVQNIIDQKELEADDKGVLWIRTNSETMKRLASLHYVDGKSDVSFFETSLSVMQDFTKKLRQMVADSVAEISKSPDQSINQIVNILRDIKSLGKLDSFGEADYCELILDAAVTQGVLEKSVSEKVSNAYQNAQKLDSFLEDAFSKMKELPDKSEEKIKEFLAANSGYRGVNYSQSLLSQALREGIITKEVYDACIKGLAKKAARPVNIKSYVKSVILPKMKALPNKSKESIEQFLAENAVMDNDGKKFDISRVILSEAQEQGIITKEVYEELMKSAEEKSESSSKPESSNKKSQKEKWMEGILSELSELPKKSVESIAQFLEEKAVFGNINYSPSILSKAQKKGIINEATAKAVSAYRERKRKLKNLLAQSQDSYVKQVISMMGKLSNRSPEVIRQFLRSVRIEGQPDYSKDILREAQEQGIITKEVYNAILAPEKPSKLVSKEKMISDFLDRLPASKKTDYEFICESLYKMKINRDDLKKALQNREGKDLTILRKYDEYGFKSVLKSSKIDEVVSFLHTYIVQYKYFFSDTMKRLEISDTDLDIKEIKKQLEDVFKKDLQDIFKKEISQLPKEQRAAKFREKCEELFGKEIPDFALDYVKELDSSLDLSKPGRQSDREEDPHKKKKAPKKEPALKSGRRRKIAKREKVFTLSQAQQKVIKSLMVVAFGSVSTATLVCIFGVNPLVAVKSCGDVITSILAGLPLGSVTLPQHFYKTIAALGTTLAGTIAYLRNNRKLKKLQKQSVEEEDLEGDHYDRTM